MMENLLENLMVMLIGCAAAWYAGKRYLPAAWRGKQAVAKAAGCGGGCDTCKACETPAEGLVEELANPRVIKIHRTIKP